MNANGANRRVMRPDHPDRPCTLAELERRRRLTREGPVPCTDSELQSAIVQLLPIGAPAADAPTAMTRQRVVKLLLPFARARTTSRLLDQLEQRREVLAVQHALPGGRGKRVAYFRRERR